MFGELGVLCYRPQPFTVKTTELSQILRISRTSLMSAMHVHAEDGRVIMNNLFKVCELKTILLKLMYIVKTNLNSCFITILEET